MPADAQVHELPFTDFVLVHLDIYDNAYLKVSQSIANGWQPILSANVIDAFLRAVAMSREVCFTNSEVPSNQVMPQTAQVAGVGTQLGIAEYIQTHVPAATPLQQIAWPPCKQPSADLHTVPSNGQGQLALYYTQAFDSLHQANCRILAKAYIKLIEPGKQLNYPYNGRKMVAGSRRQFHPQTTTPPWWPSGVTHREPDHLPKNAFASWFTSSATCSSVTESRSQDSEKPISRFALRFSHQSDYSSLMSYIKLGNVKKIG
ncbi:uncharacterized protein N7482_008916 [Penicillium canariense]|uniref:Subtelomeric hrmA-associated cluster protein AFUB-079030/YDR124W-like helical bundle domain-containing protein n=1 Tax=Penicillium canariense TaxID=189055 RepID=A0A9W9HUN9_9EURO|nr:uncharacterized protein N7482_008916 [Penicillium canariense]KAJ5157816.1 hypothetical protein N7482_008916 [Penicillium canariense]